MPPAARVQLDLPLARESVRTRGQLRPGELPRNTSPDPQVSGGEGTRGRSHRGLADRLADAEFLYVENAAEWILLATECYESSEPVNLGSGMEISIRNLLELFVKLWGFDGEIVWDTSKPDGQPRRSSDTSKARTRFGFRAQTQFEERLRRTIDWYKRHRTVLIEESMVTT